MNVCMCTNHSCSACTKDAPFMRYLFDGPSPWPSALPMAQPWTCPSCSRVWGPTVKGCGPCNKAVSTRSTQMLDRGLLASHRTEA